MNSLKLKARLHGALLCSVIFSIGAVADNCDTSNLLSTVDTHLKAYDTLGPHRSGTQGDQHTAAYIVSDLKSSGFKVDQHYFDVPNHSNLQASVTIGNDRFDLSVQPPIASQEAISGELRYWSYRAGISMPELPADGVLLVELPYARYSSWASFPIRELRNQILSAHQKPIAIILVTNGPTGEAQFLNVDPSASFLPTFLASAKQAESLRRAAINNTTISIKQPLIGKVLRAANIRARRLVEGAEHWIVSTPYSGWGHSAGERGPGVASFLYLARWAACAFEDISLEFVATSGHELENLGSKKYIQSLAPSPNVVSLWLHLGSGWGARDYQELGPVLFPLQSSDSFRFLMASQSIQGAISQKFKNVPGLETPHVLEKGSASGELSEIHAHGYQAIGLFGAHRFHHVASDRYDKTSASLVLPVLQSLQDTLIRFHSRTRPTDEEIQ